VPVIKPAQHKYSKKNTHTQTRKTEDKTNKPKAAHITTITKQQYELSTGRNALYPGNSDQLVRERYKLLVA
jgi:hypothetical protein